MTVRRIGDLKFDYVLVATVDGVMADSIRSKLVWRGVPEEKVLTVN